MSAWSFARLRDPGSRRTAAKPSRRGASSLAPGQYLTGELGLDELNLGRVDPHLHVDASVFLHVLGQDLGVAVEPAYAGAISAVEGEIEDAAAQGDARLDFLGELIEPLSGQGRDQDRPPLLPLGQVARARAVVLVELVDLVPDLDDACAL